MAGDDLHAALVEDLIRRRGVVMLIGAPNTGKTTLARRIVAAAASAGRTAAYIDADVDQSTTGPPACIGLHLVGGPDDAADLHRADAMQFVGSITPEGLVLQQVAATAALVDRARREADLVVVDTSGVVSGVIGQTLKYHKTELCRPDVVVGLQRGAELDPIVGMLRRFFSGDVEVAPYDPDVRVPSPDARRAARTRAFEEAFAAPLQRWRVRSTVFAPTLPAGLDLNRLDGVLVGLQDGTGWCLGLGVLEYDGEALRVSTNAGEGMRGLRLGSMSIDLQTMEIGRIRLRDLMFGLD
ncbi:MAG: AAA family ATPase [Actinobacteria bacterium]|nr:AAA family ATPase [Actinomycetota bacterium]